MSLLAPDCKIRGKGRGHALELDVDEGDFAARRKAVAVAKFLAVHGLLRGRRGWICGCSSAAASLCSPAVVCLQQVAAGLLGEPRVTTISIHASIAQPFFFYRLANAISSGAPHAFQQANSLLAQAAAVNHLTARAPFVPRRGGH